MKQGNYSLKMSKFFFVRSRPVAYATLKKLASQHIKIITHVTKEGSLGKNVKTINILAAVSHMSERTIIEESNILERSKVLKSVVQMVRQGRLPSLEILSVLLPGFPPINDRHVAEDKHILAKSGVCVYISPAGNTPSK